ncbi:MAG: NUDIX hydrolase [Burkholderiales bacterium]|nr:NUDIX hydrolase [Burkholderiales bacterium]
MSDPAADRHLVERALGSEALLEGGFLHVRRDTVELPDGRQATREYVRHPGAVAVIPLLDDGRLLLERQWRHPLGRVLLELPAGKLDPGEDPLACAVRELREETGHSAREWAFAARLHSACAYSTEAIELWFARGLQPGPQRLDDGEFIETVACTPDELDALAARGELSDAKTLVGLLWLQRWRAGGWALDWRPAVTIGA